MVCVRPVPANLLSEKTSTLRGKRCGGANRCVTLDRGWPCRSQAPTNGNGRLQATVGLAYNKHPTSNQKDHQTKPLKHENNKHIYKHPSNQQQREENMMTYMTLINQQTSSNIHSTKRVWPVGPFGPASASKSREKSTQRLHNTDLAHK